MTTLLFIGAGFGLLWPLLARMLGELPAPFSSGLALALAVGARLPWHGRRHSTSAEAAGDPRRRWWLSPGLAEITELELSDGATADWRVVHAWAGVSRAVIGLHAPRTPGMGAARLVRRTRWVHLRQADFDDAQWRMFKRWLMTLPRHRPARSSVPIPDEHGTPRPPAGG
ncbi:MAG: hypothetical protein R3E87_15395 [Burkholderiaceae bacterium]